MPFRLSFLAAVSTLVLMTCQLSAADDAKTAGIVLQDITVVDGDLVSVAGQEWRLLGFDTPETNRAQCEGERRAGDRALCPNLVARRLAAEPHSVPQNANVTAQAALALWFPQPDKVHVIVSLDCALQSFHTHELIRQAKLRHAGNATVSVRHMIRDKAVALERVHRG